MKSYILVKPVDMPIEANNNLSQNDESDVVPVEANKGLCPSMDDHSNIDVDLMDRIVCRIFTSSLSMVKIHWQP